MTSQLLLLALCVMPISIFGTLQCMGSTNTAVPWWAAIKFPEDTYDDYAYVDSTATTNAFALKSGFVDQTGGALYNTITGINSLSPLNLLMWNDEFPNTTVIFTGAHSKGMMAWDQSEGVLLWLMHSVPAYANVTSEGKIDPTIPDNAFEYGQNFYCVTVKATTLTEVQQNIAMAQLNVYAAFGAFKDPAFTEHVPDVSATGSVINNFTTTNGESITLLTKSPSLNGFLYENIISPYYKTDLLVESWGRPWMAPDCTPQYAYDTTNIQDLEFAGGDKFESYDDHSKWCVSANSAVNIACPADMNRMTGQSSRGGNAWCTQNTILYGAYKAIVESYTSCSSTATDYFNTFLN